MVFATSTELFPALSLGGGRDGKKEREREREFQTHNTCNVGQYKYTTHLLTDSLPSLLKLALVSLYGCWVEELTMLGQLLQ